MPDLTTSSTIDTLMGAADEASARTAVGAAAAADLTSHTGNTSNPHSVTAAQVGLGNADDTADVDKPVSTDQQAALDLKLDIDRVRDDLGAGTVLTPGADSRVSLTGPRTFTWSTAPSAPANGKKTSLLVVTDGDYAVSFPNSIRVGAVDPGTPITSLTVPANTPTLLVWDQQNSISYIADTLSATVPASESDAINGTITELRDWSPFRVKQTGIFAIVDVTGTTKTLALSDAQTFQRCTNAAGCTVTIPLNSSVPYPIGTELIFMGTQGVVTLDTTGLTISKDAADGSASNAAGAQITAKKLDTNTWALGGKLAAA